LNEILQRVSQDCLTVLPKVAGCSDNKIKELGGRFKRMQALFQLLDGLTKSGDSVASFDGCADAIDWGSQSEAMSALFVNCDLTNADDHIIGGEWRQRLEQLAFDTAQLNDGYRRALDFMFDQVTASLTQLYRRIRAVLPA
jgi:hypothetical protein